MNLFQVQAKHFVAGFCADAKNTVWEAAPIIRWMKDKPLSYIQYYCEKKGWTLIRVES